MKRINSAATKQHPFTFFGIFANKKLFGVFWHRFISFEKKKTKLENCCLQIDVDFFFYKISVLNFFNELNAKSNNFRLFDRQNWQKSTKRPQWFLSCNDDAYTLTDLTRQTELTDRFPVSNLKKKKEITITDLSSIVSNDFFRANQEKITTVLKNTHTKKEQTSQN